MATSTESAWLPSDPPPRAMRVATMPYPPSGSANTAGSFRLRMSAELGPPAGIGADVFGKKMP